MNKTLTNLSKAMAVAALVAAPVAQAGPHGYDLHNTLAPASAGLAGTSLARPQDTVSAVFGNPATLSQFTGTQFTFGATFYMPEAEITHDGSVTSGTLMPNDDWRFKADSGTDIFPVPQIAVTQDLRGLNIPATLGLGLTAVSGIGSELRGEPRSRGAGAEFIIFGVNAALGYEINEKLSVGGAATISFAQLDLGLASSSAETHDLGLRGTVGATYDIGNDTIIAAFYQTEQKHSYDNLIATTAMNNFASPSIAQPSNIGIGIANNKLMGGNLLLMADLMQKSWGSAEFWEDIYEDQIVFSVGAQLTRGKWKYRVGYGYAEDPTRSNIGATSTVLSLTEANFGPLNPTGDGTPGSGTPAPIDTPVGVHPVGELDRIHTSLPVDLGFGQGVLPLLPPVVEYLQATEAEVIYEHRLNVGVGYSGFLMPALDVDVHAGYQFEEDRNYGTHTSAKVSSWHVGFGLTWRF